MTFFLNKPFLTNLQYLGVLRANGPDTEAFLQGQLTCDITSLSETQGSFGACCDPKGRMLATFFIWRSADNYYLLLPRNMLDMTLAHLKKYIIRAKVNLQIENHAAELITSPDFSTNENHWRAQNIAAGFVWIYPATRGLLIPQMINLEKIGGVSFKKGCYVGQEIIARTENLGKLKRHLYQAEIDTAENIKIGDEITNADKQVIGIIVEFVQITATHYKLLAVLQDQLTTNSMIYYKTVPLHQLLRK